MEFKNVAAIVTGGASGLGEGSARALAAAGCRVAIL
ncbi:MAG: 3-hydroxyacyl-CoA dehydrogenase, partial [Marinobacter sp.]